MIYFQILKSGDRSRIVGLPCTEATVRGFSAVSLLLVDALAPVLGVVSTLLITIPHNGLPLYLGFFAGFLLLDLFFLEGAIGWRLGKISRERFHRRRLPRVLTVPLLAASSGCLARSLPLFDLCPAWHHEQAQSEGKRKRRS